MAITQLITMVVDFLCMTMLVKLGHDALADSALIFSVSMAVLIVSVSLLFSLSILIGHCFTKHQT
jgi:Na+-driven multidrug efflux pump